MGMEEVEGAMKLIPNWKRAHRMLSVQVASIAVLFGSLPADQQAAWYLVAVAACPCGAAPSVVNHA